MWLRWGTCVCRSLTPRLLSFLTHSFYLFSHEPFFVLSACQEKEYAQGVFLSLHFFFYFYKQSPFFVQSLQFDLWSVRNQQCMKKCHHLFCGPSTTSGTCFQPFSGFTLVILNGPTLTWAGDWAEQGRREDRQKAAWLGARGRISPWQHGSLDRSHQTWLDQERNPTAQQAGGKKTHVWCVAAS